MLLPTRREELAQWFIHMSEKRKTGTTRLGDLESGEATYLEVRYAQVGDGFDLGFGYSWRLQCKHGLQDRL